MLSHLNTHRTPTELWLLLQGYACLQHSAGSLQSRLPWGTIWGRTDPPHSSCPLGRGEEKERPLLRPPGSELCFALSVTWHVPCRMESDCGTLKTQHKTNPRSSCLSNTVHIDLHKGLQRIREQKFLRVNLLCQGYRQEDVEGQRGQSSTVQAGASKGGQWRRSLPTRVVLTLVFHEASFTSFALIDGVKYLK